MKQIVLALLFVLAAGTVPASAGILQDAGQWLLTDVDVKLSGTTGGGSWFQTLTFYPPWQVYDMEFQVYAWAPSNMAQTVTVTDRQTWGYSIFGIPIWTHDTVSLRFDLGQYDASNNPPWSDTPSFVLQITKPGQWQGQAVFISPTHPIAQEQGNYGWVLYYSIGGINYLTFSSNNNLGLLGTNLAIFRTDLGEPSGYDIFLSLLSGSPEEGVIPEPASALIWALLALCGGAATVVYRRRRAA